MLLLWLLFLLVVGLALLFVRPHRFAYAGWLAALPPAALTAWLIAQMNAVQNGTYPTLHMAWSPELGLDLALRLDGLGLFFGLIIAGIGTGVALYTAYYLERDRRQGYFYLLLFAFMASMLGVVWSDNIILLFIFWEGTSITSYLMVGFYDRSAESQKGARVALIVTAGGGLAMLAGLVLLAQFAGSYTLSAIITTPDLTANALYPAALLLLAIGAFSKSAQFPFQFWLPGAMAAPTPASAYLHSATMVKAGIYLLARLHPALHDSALWFWLLLSAGGITMLLGAISALRYYDLKRILAYATVSQLGILVLLLAFHEEIAYTAVVVGILAHALYKGPLFMVAGIIDHATGTRDIRRLAGLWRTLPWVSVAAILAALSMAGLPPFLGFLAKETLLETVLHPAEASGNLFDWLVYGLSGVAGVFFVGYSLILVFETFLRGTAASDEPATVHHAPGFGFVFAPLFLVAVGTVLPFVISWVEGPLLSPPATAIAGEEMAVHLALWHGFTPVFITSLIVIGLGIGVFLLRGAIRGLFAAMPEALSGARVFDQMYQGSYAIARWTTRYIQGGTLATQASVVMLVSVFALVFTLLQLDWTTDLRMDLTQMPQFHEVRIALLACIAAIVTVRAETRLNAIISIGVVGVTVTLIFVFFSAPDLALTQLLVEVLTVVLLVLVFYRIPPNVHPPLRRMARIRNLIVSCAVGAFGFFLIILMAGDPYAPTISDYFKANAVPLAHGANIVNVILVDFRAFDTMGEITVLAVAALGGYALLRSSRLRDIQDQITPDEGD